MERGRGVPQDYTAAAEWYRKAAEQGDAEAQCNLGWLLENGWGVDKSLEKAEEWYRKAAEQGNVRGMRKLGWLAENGRKNLDDATEWYRKAADLGDAEAMCDLGWLLENARGISGWLWKDLPRAVDWYRKAAEHGSARAQCNLGWLSENGRGVKKNLEKANQWYRKAAENPKGREAMEIPEHFDREMADAYSVGETLGNLGCRLLTENRREEAERHFGKAAEIFNGWWLRTDDKTFHRSYLAAMVAKLRTSPGKYWSVRIGCPGMVALVLGLVVWLVVWLVAR